MFLAGFDPRFEEALLLLGPSGRKILVCGNESYHYAPRAGLQDFELVLCQTLSLMGQDRSVAPSPDAVLRDAGIAKGSKVGIIGWKYLEADALLKPFVTLPTHGDMVSLMLRRTSNGPQYACHDKFRSDFQPKGKKVDPQLCREDGFPRGACVMNNDTLGRVRRIAIHFSEPRPAKVS
ncbi:hypothetical protein [Rhizobium laguerreae]|uniref:hypothetical protein n=1 Tax=Rhizobium laguerreae TaxID=1076926 RepID=UPI001C905906|nr:hypothetical protein [Rhizobium laguerreae]MBY3348014.1 hypothetical protein [Rhizobium laguerreae]MBY3354977.1 hypothetical protein [Rhizobium laguerreae]MBY3376282.1 hypothetical protein [Rhizobium laguerreae]MBY3431281.1 hypothetical protein [Rhizobium laguerreae]MBY3439896.1 hypothetical protein [Rhizobium laguerreae]